jgi:chitinase
MISYEDPQSLNAKADYVLSSRLGGILIWELAADDSQKTLVNTVAAALA